MNQDLSGGAGPQNYLGNWKKIQNPSTNSSVTKIAKYAVAEINTESTINNWVFQAVQAGQYQFTNNSGVNYQLLVNVTSGSNSNKTAQFSVFVWKASNGYLNVLNYNVVSIGSQAVVDQSGSNEATQRRGKQPQKNDNKKKINTKEESDVIIAKKKPPTVVGPAKHKFKRTVPVNK